MPSQFSRLINAMHAEWVRWNDCVTLANDDTRNWYVYDASGQEVARWECRRFPGCSSLIVTTVMEVREDLRGRGIGKHLRDFQHKAYKRAGFVGEINTVRCDNDAQNAIMRAQGATDMGKFPSDFGGEYRLWLTNLANPAMVLASRPLQTPSPIIDTCGAGSGSPFFEVFCERPLGHRDEHVSGSARWAGVPAPTVEEVFDAIVPNLPPITKKWSHRK